MGEERTEYPVIYFWVTMQRAYSLKPKLQIFRSQFEAFATKRDVALTAALSSAVVRHEQDLVNQIAELKA
ncbi:hypothetical protein [Stenotrophomonas chelatiphaga]|uniref:hypothetical protein n=1 Tax=Stenotrophomonas chelatiphaga TaxID=517011 RepID=UPI0028989A6D|nr:hypothetical protein [Stenotrophomonas chelatiphaga]